MPNPVTFDIAVGSLPEGLDTDPQGLLEAFAARLIISPSVPWSSFVLGAAQPTSDLGPWAKDGQTWWMWSDTLATYIPQVLDPLSLGYVVASADPGAADYTLWFDTTAKGIKYSNGATWTDLLTGRFATELAPYSTTTAMNAAIAAAVAAIPSSSVGIGSFSARPAVQQDIVFGGAGNQTGVVTLGTEDFDPDNAFGSSKFVAPSNGYYQFNFGLGVSISGGTPTSLTVSGRISVNGTPSCYTMELGGDLTNNGGVFNGSGFIYLLTGNEVELRYDITSDAAVTVELDPTYTRLSGFRVR